MVDRTHGEIRDALDPRWHLFLRQCGILAFPLSNDADLALDQVAAFNCDGLIFTGGDDPAQVGAPATRRDRTERKLLALAMEEGWPVIGVCRGMQFIVQAFGGTLEQVEGHEATSHEIEFMGQTRIVNSFHRGAARTLGGNLKAIASANGAIEAVRDSERPIHGIMWHPERNLPFDPADILFFQEVFGKAK